MDGAGLFIFGAIWQDCKNLSCYEICLRFYIILYCCCRCAYPVQKPGLHSAIAMFVSTSPPSPISTSPSAPPPSPTNSLLDIYPRRTSFGSGSSFCAFPSWPNRTSLAQSPEDEPSAFISDDDLYPSVFEPDEAPQNDAAHSQGHIVMGHNDRPVTTQSLPLAPLYASQGHELSRRKRTCSSRKQRRTSKPMTPIAEAPE